MLEKYSINILIIFIILLLFSFFNFNNLILIYSLFFLSLLTFLLNIKKKISKENFINKDIFIIFIFTFIISINLVANLKLEYDGYFWYFKALKLL